MNVLISLTALGVIAMMGGVFRIRAVIMPLCLLGLVAAVILGITSWGTNMSFFNNMMLMDNYAIAFTVVCIVGAMFMLMFYYQFYYDTDHYFAEVFALILFSLAGVVVMVSFTSLLMLFLGIEILSLSLYILAGIRKKDLLSNEASLKYFLMGAFSTGFLLFGIAMLYGATASFNTSEIAAKISMAGKADPFVIAGILMLMIGLLFKVAAAPFQFWTPDVYQGAPTLITGYMATVGKVAAFAAFLRLFQLSFSSSKDSYDLLLAVIAVITMTIGNITAIYQKSVKRMLAYSSIAHAGYMLIAIVAGNAIASGAILYYSVAYILASLVAFVLVLIIQQKRGNDEVISFNGLSKSNPLLAIVLSIAMLSLAGIPPTAGFFAKFYIFSSAVSNGWVWLVVLAVINSFISVYYYFRPVIAAYMQKSHEDKIEVKFGVSTLLILLSLLTLLLGILPGFLSDII